MSRKKAEIVKSPALALFVNVVENAGASGGDSWDRLNFSRNEALNLAIRRGLRFDLDDFLEIRKHFYHNPHWEGRYALACGSERGSENPSAVAALEKFLNRKPFLIRPSLQHKSAQRVYVGFEFEWYGETVTCTSFGADRQHFIAVSHKREQSDRRKVARRIKITHDDVKKYHAAIRSTVELNTELNTELDATRSPTVINSLKLWCETEFPQIRVVKGGVLPSEVACKVIQKLKELRIG